MKTAVIDAEHKTKQGCIFKILEYKSAKDVLIEFQDEFKAKLKVEKVQIKRGNIQNPYHPSVLGVGYMGQGRFRARKDEKGMEKSYHHWFNMLDRCYGKSVSGKYVFCEIIDCWLNYQSFAAWSETQIGSKNVRWHLDKDLLVKGNKIYSPDTCVFLPQEINNFMNKREVLRGDCVIGVSLNTKRDKYISQGNFKGFANKYIGAYDTELEAFLAYKAKKEAHALFLADKYSGIIDNRAVDALRKYEVHIDD